MIAYRWLCICGEDTGFVSVDKPKMAQQQASLWHEEHVGPGHAPIRGYWFPFRAEDRARLRAMREDRRISQELMRRRQRVLA